MKCHEAPHPESASILGIASWRWFSPKARLAGGERGPHRFRGLGLAHGEERHRTRLPPVEPLQRADAGPNRVQRRPDVVHRHAPCRKSLTTAAPSGASRGRRGRQDYQDTGHGRPAGMPVGHGTPGNRRSERGLWRSEMEAAELLAYGVKHGASDVHLSAGLPPMIRVDGDMRRLDASRPRPQDRARPRARHHERPAAQGLRNAPGDGFLVRDRWPRSLPRQRIQPPTRPRRGVPGHPSGDPIARGAGCSGDPQGSRRRSARPGAGHRADGEREIDHPGRDDRSQERIRARPHPHHRGSDRVRPTRAGNAS